MKGTNTKVIWLFGLSGSGKSTLAQGLLNKLSSLGIDVKWLDGDILRNGLNKDLGFSPEDRKENIRRVAEVSKLFKDSGFTTICSFITPTVELRQMAKTIIGEDFFLDIFVDCPIETCIERDPKGLYGKALSGEIERFTGVSAPFEQPLHSKFVINTDRFSIEECIEQIYQHTQNQ